MNVTATSTGSDLDFGFTHVPHHPFGTGAWYLDDVSVTCASVGSWTEQAPYPIVVSGNAVASQGGNVYSFGGIANNTAIANAYKYTPRPIPGRPSPPFPAPRGWFSAASDGTYIYHAPVPTTATETTDEVPLSMITIPWRELSFPLPETDANPAKKIVVYLCGTPYETKPFSNAAKTLFMR